MRKYIFLFVFAIAFLLAPQKALAAACDPATYDATKSYSRVGTTSPPTCDPGDCQHGDMTKTRIFGVGVTTITEAFEITCWPPRTTKPDESLSCGAACNPSANACPTRCGACNFSVGQGYICGGVPPPPANPVTPVSKPSPAPPPCKKFIDEKGKDVTQQVKDGLFRTEDVQTERTIYHSFRCDEVDTAVGGIFTNPSAFIQKLFGVILGIAGGIAVLLIIFSGYRLIMSQGNPEQIQAAKDRLYSAITGLLFIIFSTVILEVIGVDILHIPGFTR